MIEFDIHLPKGWMKSERISQELNEAFSNTTEEIKLQSRKSEEQFRIADTVLVALVSAGGMALATFVAGLLRIMQTKVAQRIVVQKGDIKVEIPAKANPTDIEKVVENLRQLEGQKVELHIK